MAEKDNYEWTKKFRWSSGTEVDKILSEKPKSKSKRSAAKKKKTKK